jgi:hypothetical protein
VEAKDISFLPKPTREPERRSQDAPLSLLLPVKPSSHPEPSQPLSVDVGWKLPTEAEKRMDQGRFYDMDCDDIAKEEETYDDLPNEERIQLLIASLDKRCY